MNDMQGSEDMTNTAPEASDNNPPSTAPPGAESPPDAIPAASRPVEPSMTIDQLAAATHMPSRTIRYYHAKGLLPAATIRGRVAFYGDVHVERLEWIAQLQDRGLKIDAIRDLVRRVDKGEFDVKDWLGVQDQLQSNWADDGPRTLKERELLDLVGWERPGLLGDLTRLGLAERKGDVFYVPSPAVLTMATRLAQVGIDLDTTVAAERMLRRNMRKAVVELVNHTFQQATLGFVEPQGAGFLDALRPVAMQAVNTVFAQEMEKELRERAHNGKIPPRWVRRTP
jgi:DNA-binding transcriptional MerR regulator